MTLLQAVNIRRSRRKYIPTPLDTQKAAKLLELIEEYNQLGGFRIELVLNNGKAFNGLLKSYGMFSGVNDYIGLLADNNDASSAEKLGYYGELLVLHATAMGLGTCWVGGSYRKSDCPFDIGENERLICAIVVGNVAEKDSPKEKFFRYVTHRKTKGAEDMYEADTSPPEWFRNGMLAVQKAPSAVNRQPVFFTYKDGKIIAAVKDISDTATALDFGIAKLHFELGAEGGKWERGNNGEYR